MLWIEAIHTQSDYLDEPYELEFVWRNLHELTKLDWLNLMREEISDEDFSKLLEISGLLRQHVPPQYIVGWAEFCGLRFKVDARVLIPRPETEELVRLILGENSSSNLAVLDIGTGSGAIAVALANAQPTWHLTASDISEGALELARENAITNLATINFVKSDALDSVEGKFDIIVSNPPYIAFSDENEVDESVKIYEPKSALFAEHRGLAIYEKISSQVREHLTENGRIYLEIGYKQGDLVKTLFEKSFPEKCVTVLSDSFGKDRMVSVT